ncbi:MAG: T9SS type A sorting domain-containing protein [Saprospiraceae bacterium]|nr:T9SS type A sorting domain-containing protein [Saprospiraceae bacterium]
MNKTLYLYLLVWLFPLSSLYAQVMRCGTLPPNQAQKEHLARARMQHRPARNSGTTCIPIKIYSFRQDGGTGGITQAELTEGLNFLNYYYLTADIEFYYCGGVTYINNSDLYDYDLGVADGDTETELVNAAGEVTNAVNVYIVDEITTSTGFEASGYAYLPYFDNSDFNRIVMTEAGINDHPGGTFVHEFGHYFSLLHTFQGTQNGNTDPNAEHVARSGGQSNCGTAGDQLCDTEADPGYSAATFSSLNCSYEGDEKDVYDMTYTPPIGNIMSYYPTFCPPRFLSAGQYGYIGGGLGIRLAHTSYDFSCTASNIAIPTNLMAALNDNENGIDLTWTDAANDEFGYLIERSTVSASTGFEPLLYGFTGPNGTSFTDSDIQANQQYWYRIKPSNGDCNTYSTVASVNVGTIYCTSVASAAQLCDDDEYVARVIFDDQFNNATDCVSGGYAKYTNLSATVSRGTAYSVQINNGVVVGGVPTELFGFTEDRCGVWVDWNQDGDFNDVDESITMNTANAPFFWTSSITVPNNALLGDTRMRVRIVYNETPASCGLSAFGETEDYKLTVTAPLPVEFSTFTAIPQGLTAYLEWETLTESNNDYFSIEHSTDAKSFRSIAQVKGEGTTFTPQSYSYHDRQAKPGINYYRLRQVDFDGQYEYSDMKSVWISRNSAELSVYPNPSHGSFQVQLPEQFSAGALLQLIDSQGREVWHMKLTSSSPTNITFTEEDLMSGIYFLKFQSGLQPLTHRIVIYD